MGITYAFGILFTLLGGGVAAWYSRPGPRERAAHQLARKIDLALDDDVAPAVTGRLGRRLSVGGAGGALTTVVAVALLALGGDAVFAGFGPLVVVAAYFAGHAAGYGVVAWREAGRPVPPGPRLARASSPTHDDYVARLERWGAWGAAGLSTLVALAVLVVDRTGVLDLGPVPWGLVLATGVLPWVAVGLDEVLARRLLDRRQVAGSSLELAWDDALRAQTLRDMVTVVIMVGFYLPIALLSRLGELADGGWPENPVVGVTSGAVFMLLGVGCVVALVSVVQVPERHFRTRLWPRPVEQVAR